MTPDKQPISVASYRGRIFCGACNTHFKALEDATIPILEPMGLGHAVALSQPQQQILALWGIKTGLAILAASGMTRDFVPKAHFTTVRNEALPPADAWIGYSPWSGPVHLFAGLLPCGNDAVDPPTESDAYQVIFCFAALAMKVVGFPKSVQSPGCPGGQSNGIISVWPEAEQVDTRTWPPPVGAAFTPKTFGVLFEIVPIRWP